MTGPLAAPLPREIGRHHAGQAGPTVVLVGSLHGNEPGGALAVEAVLEALRREAHPIRGAVVGLRGNLSALARGRRYLDRDLNRRWTRRDIEELLAPGSGRDAVEDREQRELLRVLAPLLAGAREPLVFLDLHSTSGPGSPFACMADVLRNRPLAFALPIPLILGIEEILDGSLLGWLCDLGHAGIAVEGGRSDDPETVLRLESAIWLTLAAAGVLHPARAGVLEAHRRVLRDAAAGLPDVIEIRHRHLVAPDDDFEMAPGFASFMPVQAGQEVGKDRHGPVRAPEPGLMLMPRYQSQGEDGYFLARPVSRRWLELSSLLRRLRVDRLVPLLPGVRRDGGAGDTFVADPRVARFQVVNVFHLLGYRHVRARGEERVFARRRPGFRGLQPLPPELRALGEPVADQGASSSSARGRPRQ